MSEAAAFGMSQVVMAAACAFLLVKYYNAARRAAILESDVWLWKRQADDWRQQCHQLETQLRDLAKEPK